MLSFKLAGRSFLGEILALRQWQQQQQQWSVVAWALWGQGFGHVTWRGGANPWIRSPNSSLGAFGGGY